MNDGDFNNGMVMDLSEVDNLFRSSENTPTGVSGNGVGGISSTSSNADAGAGAGGRPAEDGANAKWMETLPLDKVVVEPSRKVRICCSLVLWLVRTGRGGIGSLTCFCQMSEEVNPANLMCCACVAWSQVGWVALFFLHLP